MLHNFIYIKIRISVNSHLVIGLAYVMLCISDEGWSTIHFIINLYIINMQTLWESNAISHAMNGEN